MKVPCFPDGFFTSNTRYRSYFFPLVFLQEGRMSKRSYKIHSYPSVSLLFRTEAVFLRRYGLLNVRPPLWPSTRGSTMPLPQSKRYQISWIMPILSTYSGRLPSWQTGSAPNATEMGTLKKMYWKLCHPNLFFLNPPDREFF